MNENHSTRFWLGWDYAQSHDFSVVAIIQEFDDHYSVVNVDQFPQKMRSKDQIERVYNMLHRKPLSRSTKILAMDVTGQATLFQDAQDRGLNPIGITFTGGERPRWLKEGAFIEAHVPKVQLAATARKHIQNETLRLLPQHRRSLEKEFYSFHRDMNPRTGKLSLGSWGNGEHDDKITAICVALWTAENLHKTLAPTHAPVFLASSGNGIIQCGPHGEPDEEDDGRISFQGLASADLRLNF